MHGVIKLNSKTRIQEIRSRETPQKLSEDVVHKIAKYEKQLSFEKHIDWRSYEADYPTSGSSSRREPKDTGRTERPNKAAGGKPQGSGSCKEICQGCGM